METHYIMTLFKTTLWTGVSTFIKAISSYLMWKIIAVYTGPSGLAVLEQFQNFIQICRSLSSSLNQGIIKYVAEFKQDEKNKSKFLSSAFLFYFSISVAVTIVLFIFSSEISEKIFLSSQYQNAIKILGISIILFSTNSLLLSALNGEFEIKKYVLCNIANTIIIFTITVFLVIHQGIQGGLIGLALNQSIVLIITSYLVIRSKWFKVRLFLQGIDKNSLYLLIKYASISFAPIIITPFTMIFLRKYIIHNLSWEDAGYWQGIMKISEGYLILLEVMVNVYFLPKISGIKKFSEFKSEIISIYRLVLPIALSGLITVFLLKKQIVNLMYSSQFFPMLALFKYQLIGDIAKIGAWLLANIMAARAMVKVLVISEIVFNLTYIMFSVIFIHYFGLIGTSIGFAINNILWLLAMMFLTMRCLQTGAFKLAI